jgi:glycosyltransferase involved in cell wall biosynthesis
VIKMGFVKTTALILSYNQEDCIRDAIESVVNQTLPPDEILISDDCSTDSTFCRAQQVVEEVRQSGRFKGIVRLNRNEKNLGFIPHFNWAVEACGGDLILYNAGDDTSMPNRLETFCTAYTDRGAPTYFLGHSSVQIKGGPQDGGIWVPPVEQAQFPIERLANSSALHIGAAQCFTKALFTDFGTIRFEDAYEDLILGFRALLTDAYWYSPNPLLTYRVGGLTFWQKNTWEKKRKRYKAVLSQRNLDALQQGRMDLAAEIAMAYQDYGFSYLPHPECLSVYSCQDIQNSIFDYSIEDHFHRLPHIIHKKPLEDFFSKGVSLESSGDNERSLIFLRASLLGWEQTLAYLDRLYGVTASIVVDCGISMQNLKELTASEPLRKKLQELCKKNERIKFVSACPFIAREIIKTLSVSVSVSPFLVDLDGPSEVRSLQKKRGAPIRVFLGCSVGAGSSASYSDLLQSALRKLEALYDTNLFSFFVPSHMILSLQSSLQAMNSETTEIFELKDCRNNQYASFEHVVLLSDDSIQDVVSFNNLEWQALKQCIPVSVFSRQTQSTTVTNEEFDLKRSHLYFNTSIQKQVAQAVECLNALLSMPNLFRRLLPL